LAELRAQNHAEKEVVTENVVQEDETSVQEASSDSDSEEDFDDMGAAPDDDLDL
jgi:hypothetical protein